MFKIQETAEDQKRIDPFLLEELYIQHKTQKPGYAGGSRLRALF